MTRSYQFFSAGVAAQLLRWEAREYQLTAHGPAWGFALPARRGPHRGSDKIMFGHQSGHNQKLDWWLLGLASQSPQGFGALWVEDPRGLRILNVIPGPQYRVAIMGVDQAADLVTEHNRTGVTIHLEEPRDLFTVDPQDLQSRLTVPPSVVRSTVELLGMAVRP